MAKNTGKVREKSGNFVSLEKWEPCQCPPIFSSIYCARYCRAKQDQSIFYQLENAVGVVCKKYM